MVREEWLVARLHVFAPYVPEAWRAPAKHLIRDVIGWLGLLPAFLYYCYGQFRCFLSLTPQRSRLTVVIVAPRLGSSPAVGHEMPYSLNVAKSLVGHGIDVQVFCHRRLTPALFSVFEQEGIPCQRLFRHSGLGIVPLDDADGNIGALGRFLTHAFEYAADLTWGIARGGVGSPRLLFFPSSGLSGMLGSSLLRWPFWHDLRGESQVHVFHAAEHLRMKSGSRYCVRNLLRALFPTRLHIGTASPQVNVRLRGFGEAEAIPIPIPIPRPLNVRRRPAPAAAPRRLGFLGSARPEKGFALLPELLPRLLHGHESLRIIVQVNPLIDLPVIAEAAKKIRRLARQSDRIELVGQALAMDEYYQLLDGIDVVVLPYDRQTYAMRISAVGIEAMALGKIVVGPEIGWFAEQPRSYGAYLGVDTSNVEQLANRILEAVENFDALAPQARGDAQKFDWHSVQSLVSLLMKLATRDGGEAKGISPEVSRPNSPWASR